MSKYEYLKKYIVPRWTSQAGNSFYNISHEEILEAERKINLKFTDQLKELWMEIGCGFFEASCKELGITQIDYPNRLLPPDEIASVAYFRF